MSQVALPQPEANAAWMALCRDELYRYKASGTANNTKGEEQLVFARAWVGERGQETIEYDSPSAVLLAAPTAAGAGTTTTTMHRGALAPAWVFQSKPLQEAKDDVETYMRRLICAVTGRFVCISRTGAIEQELLQSSGGVPKPGIRYWWRYWDNEGTVYEVTMEKWRDQLGFYQGSDSDELSERFGALPGEFGKGKITWMRLHESSDMFGRSWGPLVTDLSTFWESMWKWKFEGSTGILLWDQCLDRLAELAGVI